ncbi:MAG: hypothetical protein Q4G43_01540 [Mobilicoccus sp.]|nr:hypothetical protein [Mobilicoccus sp.]
MDTNATGRWATATLLLGVLAMFARDSGGILTVLCLFAALTATLSVRSEPSFMRIFVMIGVALCLLAVFLGSGIGLSLSL